jgi:hypothetical protein
MTHSTGSRVVGNRAEMSEPRQEVPATRLGGPTRMALRALANRAVPGG